MSSSGDRAYARVMVWCFSSLVALVLACLAYTPLKLRYAIYRLKGSSTYATHVSGLMNKGKDRGESEPLPEPDRDAFRVASAWWIDACQPAASAGHVEAIEAILCQFPQTALSESFAQIAIDRPEAYVKVLANCPSDDHVQEILFQTAVGMESRCPPPLPKGFERVTCTAINDTVACLESLEASPSQPFRESVGCLLAFARSRFKAKLAAGVRYLDERELPNR